ncbi:CRISPR-associated endonuclease Cas1 [Clostridiales bacterium COT073_COT-073]|nr:CRISPR-associated endonuclease Cas1 [Clostridiales bacterium COT073_COT-073]
MACVYFCKQGAKISLSANRFQVHYKEELLQSLPVETVDIMEIFGNVQITTQAIQECLKRGINIIFYSMRGHYFGRLLSPNYVNVNRQRLQAEMSEEFKLEVSKKIIHAKINNQIVVLRRYSRNSDEDVESELKLARIMRDKVINAQNKEQLMGYEGMAAKEYFKALGNLIDQDFHFSKRSKQPPEDEFNSAISLGYALLINEICGKLESRGLNPYFGLFHQDKERHATLASDLVEEWRAILIDSTIMSLMNGKEIAKTDFYCEEGSEAVFMTDEGLRICLQKLEKKINSQNHYLDDLKESITFRQAIGFQIEKLIKAIENKNPSLYKPIMIR